MSFFDNLKGQLIGKVKSEANKSVNNMMRDVKNNVRKAVSSEKRTFYKKMCEKLPMFTCADG